MKKIISICFIFPLVSSILNLQAFLTLYMPGAVVLFAYSNLLLIIIGLFFQFKTIGTLSKTARMWIIFYLSYYSIGFVASIYHHFDAQVARTMVSVTYFIGFYFFLSLEENRVLYFKVTTYSLIVSSLLTIIFFKMNFDLDFNGVHIYKLDRAGGVYGDANNAALVSILSYIFFNKFFIAKTRLRKIFKTLIILIILFSLSLTFSTTGLSVFLIVVIMNNQKFFSKEKIVFLFASVVVLFVVILNLKSLTSNLDLSNAQRNKIDNLVNVLTLNVDKVDNSGRGDLLERLFTFIYENPFLGNGIDFTVSIKGHNTYMGVWADAGIFVFIFFCIMLLTYIFKSFKANINVRFFCLSIMFSLCVFMMSLQSVINQAYIIVIFVYLGYLVDNKLKTTNNL